MTRYVPVKNAAATEQELRTRIKSLLNLARCRKPKEDDPPDLNLLNNRKNQTPPAAAAAAAAKNPKLSSEENLTQSCRMRNKIRTMMNRAGRQGTPLERALVGYDGPFTMTGLRGAMTTTDTKFTIPIFNWGRAQGGFVLTPRVIYCLMGTLRRGNRLTQAHKFIKELVNDPEAEHLAYSALFLNHLIDERPDKAEKLRKEMNRRGIDLHGSVFGRLLEFRFKRDGLDGCMEVYRENLVRNYVPDGRGVLTLVLRLCIGGRVEEAYRVYVETGERGVVHRDITLRVLVKALVKANKPVEAFEVAERLRSMGLDVKPDHLRHLINRLARAHKYDQALIMLRELVRGTGSADGVHLVKKEKEKKKKSFNVDFALRVLEEIDCIDPDDQQVLIHQLCRAGRVKDGRNVLRKMFVAGHKPDAELLARCKGLENACSLELSAFKI